MICELCSVPFGKDVMITEMLVCQRCNDMFHLSLSKSQKMFLTNLLKELMGSFYGMTTNKFRRDIENIQNLLDKLVTNE